MKRRLVVACEFENFEVSVLSGGVIDLNPSDDYPDHADLLGGSDGERST